MPRKTSSLLNKVSKLPISVHFSQKRRFLQNNSTTESIYLSNADFVIRERCRAREDAIIHEKFQTERIEALTSEVSTLTSENNALSTEIERLHILLEEHGIDAE